MRRRNRREFLSAAGLGIAGLFGSRSLSAAIQAATSPYRRPKLKITDVRTAEVRVHGYQVHVRIYTDQGIYGQGEATDAAVGAPSLIRGFKPFLICKDPLDVEYLFETLRTRGIFAGAQAGQYVTALTGVEIALWDLAGKALGLPIYQLMGGKVRDRVRVYCDMSTETPLNDEGHKRIQLVKDLNFTAAKTDIDDYSDPDRFDKVNWTASNTEIDHMVEKVSFVRKSFDPKIDLAVDMHGRYDMTTGKRVAKEMDPFKLLWLEEPVPPENIDAMRDVRESTTTPIACGENLYLRHGYRELFEKRAADIIMPDLQKCGGLMEGRKIADMAQAYYVPEAPHCVVSPIGTMASCHACATMPNFLILEWHWVGKLDLWRSFVKEGEIIKDGFITIPDRPGIGVEMDEEAARASQIPGTPWFEAT